MKRPEEEMDEQEWIEQYLLGRMTTEESLFFENELQKDPNLKGKMEQIKQAHQVMQEQFLREAARDTIRGLQITARKKRKTVTIVRVLSMAAAACVVFACYLSLSMIHFPDSENDFTVVRSSNATTMPSAQRHIFDEFFEGQAHIAEGQYVMAVRNFETVLESDDLRPYFREAAQWHLMVAYLKSGDVNRAQILYYRFENCVDCEYQVSSLNRWKIWWQINLKKLIS